MSAPEAGPQPGRESTGGASGLGTITFAIVGAGVVGYAIQGLVPVFVRDAADYLQFSVFWSTLYLVGAALSGIQQEVARATRPTDTEASSASIQPFAVWVVLVVGAVVGLTSILWSGWVFPLETLPRAAALTAGVVGYAAMSTLAGLFYGVELWRGVATLTLADAVIRLVFVGVTLAIQPTPTALATAVVLPFPLAVALAWKWYRPRVGRYRLDVPPRQLARNTLSTIGGATATGVLTSGFPLLIDVTSSEPATEIGALVFVVTLTRAPLVVPALALQSFLTVHFRKQPGALLMPMLRIVAMVLAVSAVVAAAAFPLEPIILRALWGEAYTVSGLTCALIVLTAGATATLCVSGAAVLSANRHNAYLVGWVVAALATVAAMLLPLALEPRVLAAMAIGPVAGLVIHATALRAPQSPTV